MDLQVAFSAKQQSKRQQLQTLSACPLHLPVRPALPSRGWAPVWAAAGWVITTIQHEVRGLTQTELVSAEAALQREDSNSSRTPAQAYQAYDDRPAMARGSYTGNDDDLPTLPEPAAASLVSRDQPPAPARG